VTNICFALPDGTPLCCWLKSPHSPPDTRQYTWYLIIKPTPSRQGGCLGKAGTPANSRVVGGYVYFYIIPTFAHSFLLVYIIGGCGTGIFIFILVIIIFIIIIIIIIIREW